ncbi:MAG: DNA translocase FtsK, partial [Culicoidibacterales bacterium]
VALVAMSAIIQPNQTEQQFWQVVNQVQQQEWSLLLQTRGGVIGTQLFSISQQLIGTMGTLLATLALLLLGTLFLRKRSLADSLQMTVTQTKTTVAKVQKKLSERNENRQPDVIFDVEEIAAPIHGMFPDEMFAEKVVSNPPVDMNQERASAPKIHMPKMMEAKPTNLSTEVEEIPKLVIENQPIKPYLYPPLHLLQDVKAADLTQMKSIIDTNIERLQQIFASFKIGVTLSAVNVGPAITQYEIQPDPGVKVSRIVNLADDIALGLAAKDVRIVAPIPGKAAVGIEVPNAVVAMVSLKQTLEPTMVDLSDKLLVALGKDISGQAVTARLDKMPHLLVAGSTGSGKSVCINGIITSLLLRATPDEVKLLLVDPKKVELSYFNNIPHLLAPVVTDPKKAAFALRKIVTEMEERYEAFAALGVRNIEGYNEQAEASDKMPFIVVIIDELADLMLVASKDVEESIMRITQMARAAGIHLIVATQRPSVDVITGVIKANIPSRIAFAVSSQIDSRTILDMGGAEALIGKGDMLFFPAGESKPVRVQGAYVSEAEVIEVVEFIKAQQPTIQYNEQLLALDQADSDQLAQQDEQESDQLLPEVMQFVIEQQKASTSLIQRRFKIGYNRAARLMEVMEGQGIIGPNEGTKPRQVLKTTATYQEQDYNF